MKKTITIGSALLLVSLILSISYVLFYKKEVDAVHPMTENQVRLNSAAQLYKTWNETITIGAIGDILIHSVVYNSALTNNGYDFHSIIAPVQNLLLQPDILLANQESIIGGKELGLSTYPAFNSPTEVADAFIDAGVDIFSTANNHSLDRGEKAIHNAIQYYKNADIPYVGFFEDEIDQQTLRILNINGISVAFLAYTYGTNGIPVPDGKAYLVNLIHLEKMEAEIKRAKQEADVVVMSIHWGNEYERYPTDEQKDLAKHLAQMGVDIIFGHHPHVLQPFDWIEVDDRKVFVIYSLGNFLSGQKDNYRDIGGIATIEVTKHTRPDGDVITLADPKFYPTYVTKSQGKYFVVPLAEAEEYGLTSAKTIHHEIIEHMFGWIQ